MHLPAPLHRGPRPAPRPFSPLAWVVGDSRRASHSFPLPGVCFLAPVPSSSTMSLSSNAASDTCVLHAKPARLLTASNRAPRLPSAIQAPELSALFPGAAVSPMLHALPRVSVLSLCATCRARSLHPRRLRSDLLLRAGWRASVPSDGLPGSTPRGGRNTCPPEEAVGV